MSTSANNSFNPLEGKPQIDYPCEWEYRLIGRDAATMATAAMGAVGGTAHKLEPSHTSSKGSFVSMRLIVNVSSEEERLAIFEALRASKSILQIL
ncbi:hypothetical protein AGMMS50229_06600 [Campylobacterota bacterium]|nr:hypothetical protein AGMMS50229_06600 [Campylobacterota bacterium]